MRVGNKKRRFSFQSMDFMEMEDMQVSLNNEIVTATPI